MSSRFRVQSDSNHYGHHRRRLESEGGNSSRASSLGEQEANELAEYLRQASMHSTDTNK